MGLFQPKVDPLTPGIDLSSKTAIVTGATSGIGLELSRQLLVLKVSNLVLAVRNVTKGEEVRKGLLADPAVKAANPQAVVKVMKLDMEDYASVQAFVEAFKREHNRLHVLMLNAGIGTFGREFAPTGHEKNNQVNYLSNVLLQLSLHPILEATAEKEGSPTRVTWTGSRMHRLTTLASKAPLKPGEGVLEHFDKGNAPALAGYPDSKVLVALFQLELARRYTPEKVIVNSFCPGMVVTNLSGAAPVYVRIPVDMIKALRGRSVEQGAWIGLHAALVAGKETHGMPLDDKNIVDLGAFLKSEEGERVRRLLWDETVQEMRGLMEVPSWMEGKI